MWEQIYIGITLKQIVISAAVVVAFILLAWGARFLMVKCINKLTHGTKINLTKSMISALQVPLIIIVVLAGFYLASYLITQENTTWSYAVKGLANTLAVMGIYLAIAAIGTFIRWYREEVTAKKKNVGMTIRFMSLTWFLLILISIWLAIMASLSIWGYNIDLVTGWLGDHGWRIAMIIGISLAVIISSGEIVPRFISSTVIRRRNETQEALRKRNATLSKVLVTTIQGFIIFIAVFMILSELSIDITPVLASAGVVVIAVGFGAQTMIKDLFAGFHIIIENQYQIGDWVKIADVEGTVESINLRRTVLRDFFGVVHVVPNGEIRVASNYTKERSVVNLNINVSYNEDLNEVIKVINRVCEELAADPEWATVILKTPQVLRVEKLGDSGIDIKILGETQPMRQWEVMGELRLRIKNTFDKEGIEIPWPHTKVYFGNAMPQPKKKSRVTRRK